MERVNLLPWRQARARRQQRAWNCRAGTLLIGLLSISITADRQLRYWIQQQQRWQRAHQQSQQPLQQTTPQGLPGASHPPPRCQSPLHLLEALPRLIPAGIYLQKFHWQPPQITLQGSALSYARLAKLIVILHRDRSIPPLQLTQAVTEEAQPDRVQFCLQGRWPTPEVVADDR